MEAYSLLLLVGSLIVISMVSFVGVFTLSISPKKLEHYLDYMVALSVGGLLGGAFLHLLPELASEGFDTSISATILLGIIAFFAVEKFICWHHCHKTEHKALSFTYMNLIGDSLHNFLDGVILAAAFISGPAVGIAAAIAVFLHEIPQEIGDFGVLLKGGFSRKKALVMNFLIALTAFIGALVAIFAYEMIEGILPYFIAVAMGGFIYIAGTDLIPQLNDKCAHPKESIKQLFFILLGVGAMALLLFIE
jgi:zinc and cadmium transporter